MPSFGSRVMTGPVERRATQRFKWTAGNPPHEMSRVTLRATTACGSHSWRYFSNISTVSWYAKGSFAIVWSVLDCLEVCEVPVSIGIEVAEVSWGKCTCGYIKP